MDAQILGVDATRFLLVNLQTKRRTALYGSARKELTKSYLFPSSNHVPIGWFLCLFEEDILGYQPKRGK
jgi:hypothetical protein